MMSRAIQHFSIALLVCGSPFFATNAATAQDQSLASIGAGMKAGFMCSAVFVAGRDPEAVLREELQGINPALATIPDPMIDYENKAVTAAYAEDEAPRLAVFVEGFCLNLRERKDWDYAGGARGETSLLRLWEASAVFSTPRKGSLREAF